MIAFCPRISGTEKQRGRRLVLSNSWDPRSVRAGEQNPRVGHILSEIEVLLFRYRDRPSCRRLSKTPLRGCPVCLVHSGSARGLLILTPPLGKRITITKVRHCPLFASIKHPPDKGLLLLSNCTPLLPAVRPAQASCARVHGQKEKPATWSHRVLVPIWRHRES